MENQSLIEDILASITDEFEGISFRNLTDDEIERVHESFASNLTITPQIFIHPGRKLIAITDRSLYCHWLYFAAFEYIEYDLMIETRDQFVVVYSGGGEDVVWEMFEVVMGRVGVGADSENS